MKSKAWREGLKESLKETLAKACDSQLDEARGLLKRLEKVGKKVTLNTSGNGLVVSPAPVSEEFAVEIRRLKPDLLEVLRGAPQVWKWQPGDVAIEVSLCKSSVTDFVLAPPVEGIAHATLKPEMQKAILEGASDEWQRRVKSLGGLVIYSLSQWEAAKAKLEALV